MYAIIIAGGKEHLVQEGQVLSVEKIDLNVGDSLTFEPLLVSSDDETTITVGTPTVANAVVTAIISEHGRAEKISVIKYKPKTRYRRNVGHRQPWTKITIQSIK